MNILVTGGAGYIGSVTAAQLLEAGHTVVVYDNLARGHREAVSKDAVFIEGNVEDKETIKNALKEHDIEAVIHFAAFIEAGESMQLPEKYFHNNSINTFLLLETMLEANVKRIVFSSTAAVYGNPHAIPITEDAALAPTNAYGASKLLVEQILSWYNKLHGLRYAALRYFNASGATKELGEDHQPETHLIPLALRAVMGEGPTLKLFGTDHKTKDGTCVRDYIHVSDLASAHLLALGKLAKEEGAKCIYNLGSQKGFSNKEVLEAIGRVVGKEVPWEPAPERPGDPATLVASSEKINQELGWKPEYTNLDEIISSAYRWRKKYPNGYSAKQG